MKRKISWTLWLAILIFIGFWIHTKQSPTPIFETKFTTEGGTAFIEVFAIRENSGLFFTKKLMKSSAIEMRDLKTGQPLKTWENLKNVCPNSCILINESDSSLTYIKTSLNLKFEEICFSKFKTGKQINTKLPFSGHNFYDDLINSDNGKYLIWSSFEPSTNQFEKGLFCIIEIATGNIIREGKIKHLPWWIKRGDEQFFIFHPINPEENILQWSSKTGQTKTIPLTELLGFTEDGMAISKSKEKGHFEIWDIVELKKIAQFETEFDDSVEFEFETKDILLERNGIRKLLIKRDVHNGAIIESIPFHELKTGKYPAVIRGSHDLSHSLSVIAPKKDHYWAINGICSKTGRFLVTQTQLNENWILLRGYDTTLPKSLFWPICIPFGLALASLLLVRWFKKNK